MDVKARARKRNLCVVMTAFWPYATAEPTHGAAAEGPATSHRNQDGQQGTNDKLQFQNVIFHYMAGKIHQLSITV